MPDRFDRHLPHESQVRRPPRGFAAPRQGAVAAPVVGGTAAPLDTRGLLQLQRLAGNAAVGYVVQRDPPTATQAPTQTPPEAATGPRTDLEIRYGGNYSIAAQAVQRLWDSVGGIVYRQQQAVQDFIGPGGAATNAQPSMAEDLMINSLEVALGLALGGIGGMITARVARTVRAAALAGAIRGESSGAVPAELVGAAAHLANTYVKTTVDAGKTKAVSYISSNVRGNLPQATPLAQFGRGQADTLNEIAINQGEALLTQLAGAPETERWIVAQGLYDALRESLQDAYRAQRDAMTDTWFTGQVTSVGGGARPGVLNIELEDVYADHRGQLRVSSGNLLGAGSNDAVRGWIAERKLGEIRIPKVVRMNGSLGHGIVDCTFDIHVYAPPPLATEPAFRKPGLDPLEAFMGGTDQHVTRFSGNRWGHAWLAAHHLGLQDLDHDDPRVNDTNAFAGADKIWSNIKDRSISAMGGSIGASSW